MLLTNYNYICPCCKENLTFAQRVHLKVENASDEVAMIYLHLKPGIYQYECVPELTFVGSEMVTFYCPSCNEDLTSDAYFNFCELTMKVNDETSFQVLFSRIHGEQKTYVITEDLGPISLKNFPA